MQFSNHRSRAARGSIVYLAVDAIAPSAVQPRQNFSPAQLEELSRSIAEYGVLSPAAGGACSPRPTATCPAAARTPPGSGRRAG